MSTTNEITFTGKTAKGTEFSVSFAARQNQGNDETTRVYRVSVPAAGILNELAQVRDGALRLGKCGVPVEVALAKWMAEDVPAAQATVVALQPAFVPSADPVLARIERQMLAAGKGGSAQLLGKLENEWSFRDHEIKEAARLGIEVGQEGDDDCAR